MKKTFILKAFLLMITFTFLHTAPAFAAGTALGNIDAFNGTSIQGWVYDSGSPLSPPEILLKVTDTSTGETIREIPTAPSYRHGGLAAADTVNTGFTASVNLDDRADGTYSAAVYMDGQKISPDVYYTKGVPAAPEGLNARPLGSFRLTAYCPCRSCSEGWGRHTSSGAIAASGHTVAVDPKRIPIGSKLLINGTVYTAEDIGGGVKGTHIDIFFDTHAQARQFGSQAAEVYLLN